MCTLIDPHPVEAYFKLIFAYRRARPQKLEILTDKEEEALKKRNDSFLREKFQGYPDGLF